MIVLKGDPLSTNSIYRRRKGFGIYMTKEGHALKESYQWGCKSQWKKDPTSKNLEVVIALYFKDQRSHDIDNYNKLVLDAMSGIVYDDDKQIQRLTVEKFIDKDNARIEIEVFEL